MVRIRAATEKDWAESMSATPLAATAKDTPHTPTPWKTTSDAGHPANIRITSTSRRHIAKVYAEGIDRDPICEANAEFICRAVNAHAALLEALKALYRAIPDCEGDRIIGLHNPAKGIGKACRDARAAITLAERKQP